jgi:hypothetical protein
MLRFGSTVTLNGLVVYLAYNLNKVLLGRYWGTKLLSEGILAGGNADDPNHGRLCAVRQ